MENLMENLNVLVVGDKFESIVDNKYILKFSDFIKFIYFFKKKGLNQKKVFVYIGQGLSKDEINILRFTLGHYKLNCSIISEFEKTEYCDKKDVHKHEQKNVMITIPRRLGKNFYESFFLFDDDCAEMSDHLTGSHIQGVIVAEAARQMTLAVSERYLLPDNKKYKMSFVTNKTESEYKNYLFPLEIRMEMVLQSLRRGFDDNFMAKAEILFFQNKIQCAKIIFNFSSINKEYISEKETNMARQTIFKKIG